jgi:hypothetical protein
MKSKPPRIPGPKIQVAFVLRVKTKDELKRFAAERGITQADLVEELLSMALFGEDPFDAGA